jgi:GTP-binding protein
VEHFAPPIFQGRQPKIYFATQVSAQPPTIVLIVNNPSAFSPSYRRYLLGVLRDQLSFGEVPIKLYLHRRKERGERDRTQHTVTAEADANDFDGDMAGEDDEQ